MEMNKIHFDPNNLDSMISLMDEYGDIDYSLFSENEQGEAISLSILHDKVVLGTAQNDGRMRKNIFYRDGSQEEFFEY